MMALERLSPLERAAFLLHDVFGASFEEMDVDAVLARAPERVLVDELAHTNVPGSRHDKRWQDVDALLALVRRAANFADQGEWRETPMTRQELREGEEAPPERGGAP